jgi:hypothetical protein
MLVVAVELVHQLKALEVRVVVEMQVLQQELLELQTQVAEAEADML